MESSDVSHDTNNAPNCQVASDQCLLNTSIISITSDSDIEFIEEIKVPAKINVTPGIKKEPVDLCFADNIEGSSALNSGCCDVTQSSYPEQQYSRCDTSQPHDTTKGITTHQFDNICQSRAVLPCVQQTTKDVSIGFDTVEELIQVSQNNLDGTSLQTESGREYSNINNLHHESSTNINEQTSFSSFQPVTTSADENAGNVIGQLINKNRSEAFPQKSVIMTDFGDLQRGPVQVATDSQGLDSLLKNNTTEMVSSSLKKFQHVNLPNNYTLPIADNNILTKSRTTLNEFSEKLDFSLQTSVLQTSVQMKIESFNELELNGKKEVTKVEPVDPAIYVKLSFKEEKINSADTSLKLRDVKYMENANTPSSVTMTNNSSTNPLIQSYITKLASIDNASGTLLERNPSGTSTCLTTAHNNSLLNNSTPAIKNNTHVGNNNSSVSNIQNCSTLITTGNIPSDTTSSLSSVTSCQLKPPLVNRVVALQAHIAAQPPPKGVAEEDNNTCKEAPVYDPYGAWQTVEPVKPHPPALAQIQQSAMTGAPTICTQPPQIGMRPSDIYGAWQTVEPASTMHHSRAAAVAPAARPNVPVNPVKPSTYYKDLNSSYMEKEVWRVDGKAFDGKILPDRVEKEVLQYSLRHLPVSIAKNQSCRGIFLIGDERYKCLEEGWSTPRKRHPFYVLTRQGLTLSGMLELMQSFVLEHLRMVGNGKIYMQLLLVCCVGFNDLIQVKEVQHGRTEVSLLYNSSVYVSALLNRIILVNERLRQMVSNPLKAQVVIPHILPLNLELYEEYLNKNSPYLLSVNAKRNIKEQSLVLSNAIRCVNAELSNRHISVPSCISLFHKQLAATHWNLSLTSSMTVDGIYPSLIEVDTLHKRMQELYSTYVYKIDNQQKFNNLYIVGDSRLEYLSKIWPNDLLIQPIIIASDGIEPDNILEVVETFCCNEDVVIYVPSIRDLFKMESCNQCFGHTPLKYPTFSHVEQNVDRFVFNLLKVVQQKRETLGMQTYTFILSSLTSDDLQDEVQTLVSLHQAKCTHCPQYLVNEAQLQTKQLHKFIKTLNVRLKEACVISNTFVTDSFKHSPGNSLAQGFVSQWDDSIPRDILDMLTSYQLSPSQKLPTSISLDIEKQRSFPFDLKIIDLSGDTRTIELKRQAEELKRATTETTLPSPVVYSPKPITEQVERCNSHSPAMSMASASQAYSYPRKVSYNGYSGHPTMLPAFPLGNHLPYEDNVKSSAGTYQWQEGTVMNRDSNTCTSSYYGYPPDYSAVSNENYVAYDTPGQSQLDHSNVSSPPKEEQARVFSSFSNFSRSKTRSPTEKKSDKKSKNDLSSKSASSERSEESSLLVHGLSELHKTHQNQWEKYVLSPNKHPDYVKEQIDFKTRELLKKEMRIEQITKQWNKYWPTRMREIHDKLWVANITELQNKIVKETKLKDPKNSKRKKSAPSDFDNTHHSSKNKRSKKDSVGANRSVDYIESAASTSRLGSNIVDPVSDPCAPKPSNVTVSSVLKMALHLKKKVGLLSHALPIIICRAVHAESAGYNPLDCISEEDCSLLSLIVSGLSQLMSGNNGKNSNVEKIIIKECHSMLKSLVIDVQNNSKNDIKRIAIETMDMDGDSILKRIIQHLVQLDSNRNPLAVYPAIIKEHDRMKKLRMQQDELQSRDMGH